MSTRDGIGGTGGRDGGYGCVPGEGIRSYKKGTVTNRFSSRKESEVQNRTYTEGVVPGIGIV